MANSLLRTDKEIVEIYERHKKTLYRVCFFAYMKNHADTEDALQETFYRLIGKGPPFESEEQGLVYYTWAYPSLESAKNLEEVKEIILPKFK